MYGAVIGDIVGSRFEGRGRSYRSTDFEFWHDRCRFTDDTVCTVAVADILMNDRDAARTMQAWCRYYPRRGYGGWFGTWIYADPLPYHSFGNGAAMRVSPCAFLNKADLEAALSDADRVTNITHDHPEGIKGARAVTHSIWLALNGSTPGDIRQTIARDYDYDMNRSVDEIRPSYTFDVTCQGSVPESIICALESGSFEDGVRNAISIGATPTRSAPWPERYPKPCTGSTITTSKPPANILTRGWPACSMLCISYRTRPNATTDHRSPATRHRTTTCRRRPPARCPPAGRH